MTIRKPILCLDFDGVIHSYSSGWQGLETIPDPPVSGAIEFILATLGTFDVAILSSRSSSPWGVAAMRNWLAPQLAVLGYAVQYCDGREMPLWVRRADGQTLDESGWTDIGLIRFPTEKPPAFVTIDDRALTFTGTWPSIEELLAFQPWNKRPDADRQIDAVVDAQFAADVKRVLAEVDDLPNPKRCVMSSSERILIGLCQRLASFLR